MLGFADNDSRQAIQQINGSAPGVLAEEAKQQGALLIHFSTDYVFDGTKQTAYTVTDNPGPINTAEYPKRAQRPQNSRMAIAKLEQNYNLTMSGWDTALELWVREKS